MNTGKNRKVQGVVMTLTGGILWGLCGSCGQFLFQYKEATSNWLVPIRLMGAGILILFLLAVKNKKEILAVWEEPWGRRDILIFSVFGMMLCQYAYFTTIQYSNQRKIKSRPRWAAGGCSECAQKRNRPCLSRICRMP